MRRTKARRSASSGPQLLWRAEDMGVVLGDAADPEESVEDTGAFEAVDGAELEEPDRQLAVGVLSSLVDQDVHRAVHGLRVVRRPLHLHGGVHAVRVPLQVPRRLVKRRLGEVRRPDELVAGLLVLGPRVVLHELADQPALGMEDRQAAADLRREVKQVELGAQPPVVALLRFLEAMKVVVESRFRLPGRAVDALQLGAVLVAAPVGGGNFGELEIAEPAGGGDMRAEAEVQELAVVAIDVDHALAEPPPRCRRLDDLLLVGLVGEELETLGGGVLLPGEGLVFGDDLLHPGLDAGQVILVEVGAAGQFEVVIEAILDRRPDRVAGARPEVGDRLGEARARWSAAGRAGRSPSPAVMTWTWAPSGRLALKSVGAPSTATATAFLARLRPIEAARSAPVDPAGSCRGGAVGQVDGDTGIGHCRKRLREPGRGPGSVRPRIAGGVAAAFVRRRAARRGAGGAVAGFVRRRAAEPGDGVGGLPRPPACTPGGARPAWRTDPSAGTAPPGRPTRPSTPVSPVMKRNSVRRGPRPGVTLQ